MVMKRDYFVLLQALLLTVVVFLVGFYIGLSVEGNRFVEVNKYYIESEVSLLDTLALNNLIESENISCDVLEKANMDLLNRIYAEAVALEQYEVSGKMTENLESFHKKYDVLRTHLWMNAINVKERCGESFFTVVYLYNNSEEDLAVKAEQNVWSKLLYELKQEKQDKVFLIPIDYGTNLVSLNSLVGQFEFETLPIVIINEEIVLDELVTKQELFKMFG